MPYIAEEGVIYTKLRNVKLSNAQDTRQEILLRMSKEPESVRIIYSRGNEVFVLFHNNQNFCIGNLTDEYRSLIDNNLTKIVSWTITGGYKLNAPDHENLRANLGINIKIKILDKL